MNVDDKKMCEDCWMEFTFQEDLDEHVEDCHGNVDKMECSKCELMCKTKKELEKHVKNSHHYICPD